MSKYTTEVRFICEQALGLTEQGDYSNINDAISAGRGRIFTFDYELFDNNYKSVIETKFLRHFYTREIGYETFALWKLKVEDRWLMKLPYYNKLWESALLEFNPFHDVDYTVTHEGSGTSNREDNSTNNATGTVNTTDNTTSTKSGNSERNEDLLQKFSDTPQGGLNGVIDTDWLTNATQNINTIQEQYTENGTVNDTIASTTSNTNAYENATDIQTTDEYVRRVVGKMGMTSYSKLLSEWRKTFLNIDEMFINEFKSLFMLIY